MSEEVQIPNFEFVIPSSKIKTVEDIKVWEESEAYQEYLGFIIAIADCIKGKKFGDGESTMSPCCSRLIELLLSLRKNVDECPPCEMQSRYGNTAYRDWFTKLEASAKDLLNSLLEEKDRKAVDELEPYLINGFGNQTRIDYGTGHEMTFVMFLCALFKIGALIDSDKQAVGLKVFPTYMTLCRDLQTIYRMEPAGSMGVWNLDDYQFVPFILGAAQLTEKARIKPKAISDPEMAEMLAKENHFFACLAYIHKVKSGPFHEHSNQLWNISGVPMWSKVYSGLLKMYRAEVLCKFPVMQHTLFGSVFTLSKAEMKNKAIVELINTSGQEKSMPPRNPMQPSIPGGIEVMSRFPRPPMSNTNLPPSLLNIKDNAILHPSETQLKL